MTDSGRRLDAGALIDRYPRLLHVTDPASWPAIRRWGLLSTTALLDRYGIDGERRLAIESRRRPAGVCIEHPVYGTARIRDQLPLQEAALAACLDGMTPREWCEALNRRVFFWLTEERLVRLLGARVYRGTRQAVITVDTAALLVRHAERVTLSPINSGSTIRKAARRGVGTFRRIEDVPVVWWRTKRIAELAVDHAVPDIADVVESVVIWEGGRAAELLWQR